jgi:hypothetical protein
MLLLLTAGVGLLELLFTLLLLNGWCYLQYWLFVLWLVCAD